MVIDAHCHILPPCFGGRHRELAARDATYAALFPRAGGRVADAEGLLSAMDAAGVDAAIVMGFGWTDAALAAEVNDYLLDVAAAHPGRLTALASVNPAWGAADNPARDAAARDAGRSVNPGRDAGAAARDTAAVNPGRDAAVLEAERCLRRGAAGIGELHADTQGFDLADYATMAPLMGLLREWRRPLVLHASEPVGHQYPGKGRATPARLLRLVCNFPDNLIVLAHLGGGLPFYAAMPEVGAALANAYYDTAALPFLYRPQAVAAAALTAGSERIMFGSDYPLLSHKRVLGHISAAGLDADDAASVLGGNAAALLAMGTLPDYLREGLDIALIGLNPSARSVRAGRYFANPRNRFWAALSASGLARRLGADLGPDDDARLPAAGIGLTDVVKRATAQASGLTAEDYRRDAPLLRDKLRRYSPAIACFHGLTAYRAYLRYGEQVVRPGELALGRQEHTIGNSRVFVLPNPSPANARYGIGDLTEWYRRLGEWRRELAA